MKYGLIDLGSNSARMTVIEEGQDRKLYKAEKYRCMTRLSEGMTKDRLLKDEAICRTIDALKSFKVELDKDGAKVLAVATAAVRGAKNGAEFCERVWKETGIRLNVISGETEAYLDFCGVMTALPEVDDCVIMDTGGGSTELILVKERRLQEKISLPFGAMVLTDRYLRENGERPGLELAKSEISAKLDELAICHRAEGLPIIGMGGSVGTLANIDRCLRGSLATGKAHGYVIEPTALDAIMEALLEKTPEQRSLSFNMEAGRADTICAGILPAMLLLEKIHSPYLKLCEVRLDEGLISLLEKFGAESSFENIEKFLENITNNI